MLACLPAALIYARLSITLTKASRNPIDIHISSDESNVQRLIARDIDLSGFMRTSPQAPEARRYRLEHRCLLKGPEMKKLFCAPEHLNEHRLGHLVAEKIFEDATGKKAWFASRIALVNSELKSYKNRRYALEVIDSLGEQAHTVFESNAPIMSPAWSHDGQFLAYVSFEGGKASLWRQHLSTGARTRLSDAPGINGAPAWSPDGTQLAFVLSPKGTPKIALMNLSSGAIRVITQGNSLDTEPCWHPNGQKLYYTSSRGEQPQIYELDLASGHTRRVTFFGSYNATPSISGDGKRLATLTRHEGRYMVVVHELDQGTHKVLSAQGSEEQPMIHRSGEVVLFGIRQHNRMQIAMAQVDAPSRYQLPSDQGWVRFASWSP